MILLLPLTLTVAILISFMCLFSKKRLAIERVSFLLVPAAAVTAFHFEYQRLGLYRQFEFSFGEVWVGPLLAAGFLSSVTLIGLWSFFWFLRTISQMGR